MGNTRLVVFVHGWSVTHTDTYGELPRRLGAEARAIGIDITVKEIFLGRYVSFRDEVRLNDVSRAFEAAVKRELSDHVQAKGRFACITHSTGGPVIRDWWNRYYVQRPRSGQCPMSHLIMLAPANFGSALAVLGKGRLGRMKSWFGGIEPGQGVLDWLALGSDEAWDLNTTWIRDGGKLISARSVFPFVLSGQTIDRKLYDNLNSYTGETGSDGVVRVAGANLNSQLVKVAQEVARPAKKQGQFEAPNLKRSGPVYIAPASAMRVIGGKSHSGTSKGIMRSVKATLGRPKDAETVGCILDCLQVSTKTQYDALGTRFAEQTAAVQSAERIEQQERFLRPDNYFVHDRYSMVIFRLTDHQGQPVNDFDLLLTAGEDDDPNHLPKGFFIDRQRNSKTPNIIT